MKRQQTMKQKPKEMLKPPSPPNPPNPLDEVAAFVIEQQQLKRALALSEQIVTKAEAELVEARTTLAEAESARLMEDGGFDIEELDLRGDDSIPGSPESCAFIQASLALEQARAARGGCIKRTRDSDPALLSAAEKLRGLRQDYNREVITQFLEQTFQPAAAAFTVVLRRGDALARALGCEIAEVHRLPDRGDWQQDPEARQVHKEHIAPRELAESLEEFRRDAEGRVLVQERNRRHRAGFDPGAKYRAIREFQYYGQEFATGAVVDRHMMDLKTLSQLYAAKRLELLEPRDEWSQ